METTKSSLTDYYGDASKISEAPSLIPGKMLIFLKKKVGQLHLKDISLLEKPYAPLTWQETAQVFKDYPRNRIAFLKLLAYSNTDECLELGLNEQDLELMRTGVSPENYNTHLKIPFDFGGNAELDNFALVKTHPTHDLIHSLIELQIASDYLRINKKVFIPTFKGRIYHDQL